MTTTSARACALAGGVALALALLSGCGSKDAVSATPPQAGAPSGIPTSVAGAGDDGSVDAKVCAAIATDVAAITKNVSGPSTFPGQCAFGGGATTVTFNVNDPQHQGVTAVLSGADSHQIAGIGDGALWYDGIGEIAPSLGAWKGNVSCLIQPDSVIDNDTVTHTGKAPFEKISDADAAAYAHKLGAVCNDVFTATG